MKDLKFILDLYKDKDARGETYYFTIKAIDKNGMETVLLSHENNKTATGATTLKGIANRAKKDFVELVVEEYRAFTYGSAGAIEPVAVHHISLANITKQNSNMDNQFIDIFGDVKGFMGFVAEQGRKEGEFAAVKREIERLELEKSNLLAKLGDTEQENKNLLAEIRNLENKIRDERWKYDDTIREMKHKHDDELRKYKGQSAIISAATQGLGSFIVKKMNISDSDLQGLLGFDSPESQNTAGNEKAFDDNIQVTPENTPPEVKQKADSIYQWLLQTTPEIMAKVYDVFSAIASDEQNLNDFYELVHDETANI